MRIASALYVVLSIMAVVWLSCKKEDKCVAGGGGTNIIQVSLQHHEHTITNLKNYRDTVYVKFNVQDFPGNKPENYDATFIGEYGQDYVRLTNLKCGNYYLYVVGLESTHFERVSGGIPCVVEQDAGELKLTIPVSE